MRRAYLDNNICSGRIIRDLPPDQLAALDKIEECKEISLVTSREAHAEQNRIRDPVLRERVVAGREYTPRVQDHVVLGMQHATDHLGGLVVGPLVSDVTDPNLLAALLAAGLERADAMHLMYAVSSACTWFVTLDRNFGVLPRGPSAKRSRLVAIALIPIVTPIELSDELAL